MNLRSGGTESENKWIEWLFLILVLGLFNKREIKEDNVTYFVEAASGLQLFRATSSYGGATTVLQEVPSEEHGTCEMANLKNVEPGKTCLNFIICYENEFMLRLWILSTHFSACQQHKKFQVFKSNSVTNYKNKSAICL